MNSKTKVCSMCGLEKPLNTFGTNGKKLRSACRSCVNTRGRIRYDNGGREYMQKWRDKNRDHLRNYLRVWTKEWRRKNPEAAKAIYRRAYLKLKSDPLKWQAWMRQIFWNKLKNNPELLLQSLGGMKSLDELNKNEQSLYDQLSSSDLSPLAELMLKEESQPV